MLLSHGIAAKTAEKDTGNRVHVEFEFETWCFPVAKWKKLAKTFPFKTINCSTLSAYP